MTQNTAALMAVHPIKRNNTRFSKALAVHDFCIGEPEGEFSLVSLHSLRTNTGAHRRWVKKREGILKATGYPTVLAKELGNEVVSRQPGTIRFGDYLASALHALCKAWYHDKLYVVDSSIRPSGAAVNRADGGCAGP